MLLKIEFIFHLAGNLLLLNYKDTKIIAEFFRLLGYYAE
jgi:hypothetical protein